MRPKFTQLALHVSAVNDGDLQLKGTIPAKLTDFKITPPELLLMPIHNDNPVTLDLTWQPDTHR